MSFVKHFALQGQLQYKTAGTNKPKNINTPTQRGKSFIQYTEILGKNAASGTEYQLRKMENVTNIHDDTKRDKKGNL